MIERLNDKRKEFNKEASKLNKDVEWDKYEEVLFIGKSIGTAIAAKCGQELGLNTAADVHNEENESA